MLLPSVTHMELLYVVIINWTARMLWYYDARQSISHKDGKCHVGKNKAQYSVDQ